MPKRSAIHPTVIVVSTRKHAANSNFPKSPLGRVSRSVAVHFRRFNPSAMIPSA